MLYTGSARLSRRVGMGQTPQVSPTSAVCQELLSGHQVLMRLRAVFVLKGGRHAVKEKQLSQRDAVRAERASLRHGTDIQELKM